MVTSGSRKMTADTDFLPTVEVVITHEAPTTPSRLVAESMYVIHDHTEADR